MIDHPCKAAAESYKMTRMEKQEITDRPNFVLPAEVNQVFHAIDNL